jgi:hypothetical protein
MDNKTKSKQFLANFIKPEITSELITLQPQEVNPFERMGPVPSVPYSGVNRPGVLF